MHLESEEKLVRNKDKGNFLVRYIKSFFHAIDGIIYTIKNEHNMKIMLLATIVVVIAGLYYSISVPEWLFCVGIIGAVIASEMINTTIEAVVDLISPEKNKLAKIAKTIINRCNATGVPRITVTYALQSAFGTHNAFFLFG